MPDKLQALYDNLTRLNPDFRVPVDQFRQDMQDENKLKTLHTNLSKNYPDFKVGYDQFKSDMWSTNPSPAPATAPAVPDVPVTPAPTQTKASAFPDLTPEGLSFQEKPLTVPGGMTSVLPTEVPKMPEVRQTVGATKLAADPIQVFEQKNIVPSVEQAAAAKPEEYFKEGITEVAGAAQPSKVTEAPPLSTTGSPVGDYIKTIGSSFLTSGKTALAETGIAIVDQVNQVNNLLKNISDNPTWQKYAANVSSTVAEDMNNLRRMKAEAGQLTGKPGEFIGSMIPFAGMAAATMVSKSPALAAATTGLFAEMGYGSGIEAYDQYKKETGGDTDPKARAGAGILYGAAMSVPISRYLGKLMPKGLFQKALSGVLASNPAATEVLGKEIFENFAKKSPGLAKRLLTVSAKGALHGAAAMEAMELSKKAVDDFVIGKNVTFSDYLKTAVDAAQSGAAFGLMTAPFGVYAQSSANTDRRRMQGSVTITMDPNGKPVEIIPTKDGGQEGLTPNGRVVEVTPDMAQNSVTIPTPEFENFIKIHKETGSVPVTFDRDVYAGRTRDILNNASGGGEFVNIAKDAEGNSYFVIGKDENGNYRAVDTNGTEGVLDANTPVSRVNKGAAYTSLLKEFDANQKAQEAENQRTQQQNDFIVARDQAAQTVRQNFDALAQPDGNLHVGVDKSGNEVVIVSQTPGGYAILADGTQVDISDIKDIQLHPFESLFGQQMAEFDAANDPDLQPAVAPQVQSTFNWNGRTMQLTDVSDRNDLMVQEIDAEGEPVGRPEKISAEEYRKVIEQQVDTPEAQPELRTYDLSGKQVPFTPKEDGTLVSEDFKTPEEAEAAKTELEKQIGAANDIAVNTVPGPDNLAPATYQLAVTPKTEDVTEQLFTEAKPEPTDQLFKEGEASYVLNGQPIERGKAMARVKSAIFEGNRKKIENLEVSGDKELTDMIEKAFPIKITIGKKKASTEDALNWIDAADTIEELRKLNIEGAPATNDIRTAYTLKVKELTPEVTEEESNKMLAELFAPEITEQKVEQPIKTKEDDSTNIERLPSGEPRRETAEQTGPDKTGGRGETATGGNVQGDEQVSREQEQGRTTEVRAEDQRPEAAAEGRGLKPSFRRKNLGLSKYSPLYGEVNEKEIVSIMHEYLQLIERTDLSLFPEKSRNEILNNARKLGEEEGDISTMDIARMLGSLYKIEDLGVSSEDLKKVEREISSRMDALPIRGKNIPKKELPGRYTIMGERDISLLIKGGKFGLILEKDVPDISGLKRYLITKEIAYENVNYGTDKAILFPKITKEELQSLASSFLPKKIITELGMALKDGRFLPRIHTPRIENLSAYTLPTEGKYLLANTTDPGGIVVPVEYASEEIKYTEVNGVKKITTNSAGNRIHPTDEGIRNFWEWFGNSKAVDELGRPLVLYHGTSEKLDTLDPGMRGDRRPKMTLIRDYLADHGILPKRVKKRGGLAAALSGETNIELEKLYGGTLPTLDRLDAKVTWVTNDYKLAKEYAGLRKGSEGVVLELYIRIEDPVIADMRDKSIATPKLGKVEGALTNTYPQWDETNQAVLAFARKEKTDGAIIRGVIDSPTYKPTGYYSVGPGSYALFPDTYLVFDAGQIKSVDSNSGEFSKADNRLSFRRKTVKFDSTEGLKSAFETENVPVNYYMLTPAERKAMLDFTSGKGGGAIAMERSTGDIYAFIAGEGKGILLRKKKKPSPSKLADLYKTRLSKLKKDNPKRYWPVDLPSDEDLLSAAKDGRLIDMAGGMAYVTKDGDLKGLFKYDPEAHGTAKVLQAERIKMGGIKLDAFDTEGTGEVSLVPTYKKNGFREVARVDFNPEFAPEDMPEDVKAMNPDVVVMVYDPENKLPIKERRFNKDQYEEALAYRDSYVAEKEVKVIPDEIAQRLTEDGKGNYVFVHYAPTKQEVLAPSESIKKPSSASSSGEVAAKASVGGVVDYYVEDIPKESGIGDVKHTVLVPKDKVYYLQSDALGLYDKAKEEFQKVRPGIAFDGNYQAAWIAKEASKLGYDMVVSDWRKGLIGKSVSDLVPEETEIKLKARELKPQAGDIVVISDQKWNVVSVDNKYLNLEREGGKRSIPLKVAPNFIQSIEKKKPFSLNSLIKQAAAETETNPTEAQIEAGNYKKGHVSIQGMDISIENPKGSVRSGVDEDGKAWETEMKSHYGYFKGTVGKDGDHIDVFIGPKPANQFVFVIDQNDPKTGEFDESKVMLGYDSAADAKAAYLANYEPGWNGFGAITEVPMEQFKGWLYDGARQRKPFGEYVEVKKPISFQARKLYAGLERVPEFNNLTELTAWLQKWSKKNKVFASDEAKADDDKFVKALVKHTIEELKAFEELSDYPYIGFYDYDIPAQLNPELAKFAEKRYGHELSPAQVALYHLVSGFASPSADPVMDSSKGLDVFDKYMRTGKLTSASDKQATVWEVNEQGKKVDTGKPKFDEQGNPVFSQVTVAYATPSLNKFRDNVLGHFKGDLDKAIDWITSVHSYDEIARIMGVPTKGKGSLEEHENLTKTDGGFGIFGFTGPKLGSYILNRLGNFSTVTKDLWYARTMARLTGESLQEKTGEALKLPWNLTVEGKRKRALADKAWVIVADKLGITPADVQQRMWEFEKRLYEKLGAKGSSGTTGYASEGFMKRAKELEPDLFVEGEEVKPSYRKGIPQVSGQNSEAKPFIEQWESDAKFQTPVFVLDNAEIVDRLAERYSKESLQEIRDAEFWGLQVDDEMYIHPDTDPETALLTWAHEKSHIVLENQFPDIAERNRFLRFMHRTIGEKELHRVLPDVYWDETPEQQVKEYFATLVEDVITDEGLLRDAPASVKRIIFDQINEFTTVKYLQDAKTNISRQTSTGGQADARTTETIGRTVQETPGDQAGAETDNGLGRVSSTTDRGKEINKVFSFEDLFEPSYKKETPETIDVDGIKRPTTNSNGQPIHPTEEGIRNFWKWFGDSKVVDEKGRPLVVYHGTAQIFDAFLKSKAKDIEGRRMSVGWGKDKFYFADSGGAASIAASGAEFFGKGKNQNVMPVYLRMLNPMDSEEYERVVSEGINSGKARDRAISDADKFLKGKGIDGIESTVGGYAVFSPNQIKSATGNLGGFDPNDPRISYKRKRELSPDRKQVLTTGEHIREILVNNKLALENWMKDVETVVPTIEDYENPLLKDALAKSKVTHKLRVFEKGAYKNLINAVANVLKTSGITKEELSHYLIAVHGVERNEKFWERQPDRVGEDFSGLTELKEIVRAKADPAEQLVIDGMNNEAFAQYYQKQIEDKMDPGQAKELWKSIREISKLVRDEMLDSGMISREYYDELNQMYKNYIPLRAWEDSNPEDFEFSRGVGSYTEPIIRAKGRKSLAEDPLATLLQMANTAYISGERNRVKQAAGELVRNNASALKDVVQYNRTYFVNQGTDAQGNPIIQETIDRPDQALFDQGLVTTKVPKQYTVRRTSAQAKEFEVEFYRNGRKYVLVFQGSDPAVARAINNKEASVGLDYLNKVVGTDVKIGKITIPSINKMSRYLSSINTTYSVDFPLVNFVRDAPMAILSEWVYGDAKEVAKMFPNMKRAEAAMRRMLRGNADPANNADDAQLEDFFKAGGPTGFAFLKNVDEFKQSIANDVRRINRIKNPLVRMEVGFRKGLDLISQLAEWSETITRFGVYLNHIQNGESKEKAALAAKNATVNFDQKGRISPALNGLYTFFNAAVQAVDKYFKLWGRNPYKMGGIHMFLMVQAFMNAMLLDLFGGEDEDKVKNYDKVSDYTKRNNLVIPVPGTDKTVSIAVPQILRKFHAIGFDAYDLLSGRKTAEQVMLDELASIPSDVSPIDAEAFLNGEGDLSMKPLVPSILRPIVELEANENFMKLPIVPEPFSIEMAHKIADTRRAYKDVNKIAQWTTDKLYELGGGDETGFKYVYDNGELHNVPALLDISPESIEHLFESYFGGVGKLANRTWKTTGNIFGAGKKLYEGENFKEAIKEIDINTVPVANRFVRTPVGDPLQKEFRKVRNDMENKIKVLDQAEKDQDWAKFEKMYEEIGGKINDYKAIMTTFENLDKAYSIVSKEDKKAAEDLKAQMREQMKEIVKLK